MGRRFSEAEVKRIIIQLLSILNDLHCPAYQENAVVHRDLRLSNLLLKGKKVFLIDFGFARFLNPSQHKLFPGPPDIEHSRSSDPNSILIKQAYDLPPGKRIPGFETYRLLRRDISPRSDLFGTGVVAVDLFTSWVEDESLFKEPWHEVLTLSEQFTDFLKKLLSQEGFETAAAARACLRSKM